METNDFGELIAGGKYTMMSLGLSSAGKRPQHIGGFVSNMEEPCGSQHATLMAAMITEPPAYDSEIFEGQS